MRMLFFQAEISIRQTNRYEKGTEPSQPRALQNV